MPDWLEALLILIGLGVLICGGAWLGGWHASRELDRALAKRDRAEARGHATPSTGADAAMVGAFVLPAAVSGSEDGSDTTSDAGSLASSMSNSYSSGSDGGSSSF